MKNLKLLSVKEYLLVILAALCCACSLEIFLIPNKVIVGGAVGIATILEVMLPNKAYFSSGIWVFAINIPIIIYCFVTHRKNFAVKTTVYIVLLTALLMLFKLINLRDAVGTFLLNGDGTADTTLYSIVGGALQGLSLPIMLSVDGSTGGSDIAGVMLQRHRGKSTSESMLGIFAANVVIIIIGVLAFYFFGGKNLASSLSSLIHSLAGLFVFELVQESVFKGFSSAYEFQIATDNSEAVIAKLSEELKRGSTVIRAEGGYSHGKKDIVLCIIHKNQLTHAKRVLNEVDPHAFTFVEPVREVIGRGFINKEMPMEEIEE